MVGSDGALRMRPVKELEALRMNETIESNLKLKFDTRKSGLGFGRKIIEEAPLELLKGEPLVLRFFVDKSIVEVYANNKQAIARMVYPTLGGTGVSLFSEGGNIEVKSIKEWELSPSNPY